MAECHQRFRGMLFPLKIAPSHGGSVARTRGSLGPSNSASQTAPQPGQLFTHSSQQTVPNWYFTMGRPFPQKIATSHGDLDHGSLGTPEPFCRVQGRSSQDFAMGHPIPWGCGSL